MKIRHSNAYAALTVLVLVSILFIGMYAMMDPFARIFSMFTDNANSTIYFDNPTCTTANKHWYNGVCNQLPARADSLLYKQRRIWLTAPIIFIIGLVFWYITASTRKDPNYFQQQPPQGGFQ